MGLTQQSTGFYSLKEMLKVNVISPDDIIIALAGNPNTGKSTLFNSLTGLKQHTGNWPGKTVSSAQGIFYHKQKKFIVIDLPGTYSLFPNSVEEKVARDFICFGKPKVMVVVVDATCLERNLNLAMQILELCSNVVICVNLIDEAERKGINIDTVALSQQLGVPVIGTNARDGIGLDELKDTVYQIALGNIVNHHSLRITYDDEIESAVKMIRPFIERLIGSGVDSRWIALRTLEGDNNMLSALKYYLDCDLTNNQEFQQLLTEIKKQCNLTSSNLRDKIVESILKTIEKITSNVVTHNINQYNGRKRV